MDMGNSGDVNINLLPYYFKTPLYSLETVSMATVEKK